MGENHIGTGTPPPSPSTVDGHEVHGRKPMTNHIGTGTPPPGVDAEQDPVPGDDPGTPPAPDNHIGTGTPPPGDPGPDGQ